MKKNILYSIFIVFINTLYPLLVFPYISRVLSVESIGTYNYYNLLFSYLSIITNFGISLYASKEIGKLKDDLEKRNKLTLDLITINLINFLLVIILFIIPLWVNADGNDKIIILLFCIMLFSNAFSSEWYFVATENQKFIFIRNIAIKCISLPFIYTLVRNKNDVNIYVLIVVLGLFTNAIINLFVIFKEIDMNKINLIEEFGSLLSKRYYKGLLSIFMVECCFRYFGMIDIAIIEKFESREKIGFLTFALSIYNIISSFLKIIATTLLPRASYYVSSDNENSFFNLTKDSISLLFLIGLPTSFILFFAAEPIVLFFGGKQFYPAITLIKEFSFLIIITAFCNILVFQILYPLNKSKEIITCYLLAVTINILSLFILIPKISLNAAILCSFISHIFVIFFFFIREKEILTYKIFSIDILKYVIASILALMVISFLNKVKLFPYDFNLLSIVIGTILYLFIIVMLKDKFLYKYLLKIKKNVSKC